jgi:hypothetical protein
MACALLTFMAPALFALHLGIYRCRDGYAVSRSPDFFQVSQTAIISTAATVVYVIAFWDDVPSPKQHQVGQGCRIILYRSTARQFDRSGVSIRLASTCGYVTVPLLNWWVIAEEISQSPIDVVKGELSERVSFTGHPFEH